VALQRAGGTGEPKKKLIRFKRKSPSPPHSGTSTLLLGTGNENEDLQSNKKTAVPRSKEQVRDSRRTQPMMSIHGNSEAEAAQGPPGSASKPKLAQDLIKSLMDKESLNQKQQPSAFMSQSRGAGGPGSSGHKLKLRRSPPSRPSASGSKFIGKAAAGSRDREIALSEALNFTTDMKRLGLMADIQNNMKDHTENKKKLVIQKRHISPPPNLQGT